MDDLKEILDAATPGPWRLGSWQDNVFGTGPKDEWLPICRVKRDDAPIEESRDHVDARLIAMAPDLAAEVLRMRAEVERLKGALGKIADAVPHYDYVQAGPSGVDLSEPGSPYDRGKAEGFALLQPIARAALKGNTK